MSDNRSFHQYSDEEFNFFDAGESRDAEGRTADAGQSENLSWWGISDDGTTKDDGGFAGSFSYSDAFDDSSPSWYRQSSFRYSGYRDYSPSRLFRSSFSSFRSVYYAATEENEAKNKAIRALRTLTRNANTVADASAKITYAVQFSSGVDSNGVSAAFGEGKNQVIYVSPDAVLATTNADAEDAEIDAMTGFVLLRVQISQEINTEIIADINKTSMRALPHKLMQFIYTPKKIVDAGAQKIASELVDEYAAGILAKSMITRLSRRSVVQNWGGFAPYFVRHAKKFAHTRDAITAGELSVEKAAAQIAYNMLADENEIEIAPEILAIVEKHLGEKVAPENILPACLALVADLRAYFNSLAVGDEPPPAGEIENAITELLDEFAKMLDGETEKREQKLRDALEDMAEFFDAVQAAASKAQTESFPKEAKVNNDIASLIAKMREQMHLEKVLTAVKQAVKNLDGLIAAPSPHPTSAQYIEDALTATMAHFSKAVEDAAAPGKDAKLPDITERVGTDKGKMQNKRDKLAEYAKKLTSLLRKEKTTFRKDLAEITAAGLENIDSKKELNDQLTQRTKEQVEKLNDTAEELPEMAPFISTLGQMRQIFACRDTQRESYKSSIEKIDTSKCKTMSQLVSTATNIQRMLSESHALSTNVVDLMHYPATGSSEATEKFKREARDGHHAAEHAGADVGDWHDSAIDNFVNSGKASKEEMAAMAINEALGGNLRDILSALTRENSLADALEDLDEEQRQKLEALARSLGLDAEDLLDLLNALNNVLETNAAYEPSAAEAKELGKRVKDKIIDAGEKSNPADENLFGKPVERKTTLLDPRALSHANEEAQHAAEEEYVAYLSSNESRPTLTIKPKKKSTTNSAKRTAAQIKARNRGAIERVKNALQFQSAKRTGEIHGTLSGDLDEGSLHKLRYDSEHIWSQKTVAKLPDVAVGILVDQSGSMSGGKIEEAREMCIVLAEALKRIEGMHLHIYGHTANMRTEKDLVLFEHYSSQSGVSTADLSDLGDIQAFQNNYDGYAIKETARLLNKDPAKRKYLFVIADGLPHGTGYAGADAQKHVKSVCSFVRTRLKIPTYAFAVGVSNGTHIQSFKEQYGANNVMFLKNVTACLPQIVRFLRNTLQKEKSLVSVSAD